MGHLYHGYVSHYQRVLRFGTMACDNSSEGEKTSSSCHVFGIYCGLNELKHGGQPTFFFTFSWRTASKSDLSHKLSMKIHGKRDQWPLLGTLEVYLPCIYIWVRCVFRPLRKYVLGLLWYVALNPYIYNLYIYIYTYVFANVKATFQGRTRPKICRTKVFPKSTRRPCVSARSSCGMSWSFRAWNCVSWSKAASGGNPHDIWSFEWDNSPWNNEIFMGKSWEIDRKVCYGKPPFLYNG